MRNFYKATRNANPSWSVFPHWYWTLSHANWSLCCPVSTGYSRHPSPTAFPQSLCPIPLAFPYPLPVTLRSRAQAFFWFRTKTNKGIVCLADHLCLDYILTACIKVSTSFSFFAKSFMSSMYIRWLIFSCDLLSLYPAVHFLNMWFNGIMAIMNCRGDGASPSKIPLWIFVSAKLFPPAVNSTLQFFVVFSMKFMI